MTDIRLNLPPVLEHPSTTDIIATCRDCGWTYSVHTHTGDDRDPSPTAELAAAVEAHECDA